jgi:Uma2 family endonuclease
MTALNSFGKPAGTTPAMTGATMRPVKAIHPRVSYADLERAPEDGRRYELYDGEVFVVPSPLPKHQVVALRIAEILSRYADAHGGFCVASPIDIVLSDYDVLQPDVIYFSPARAHLIDLNRVIRHPPDLCVEVLSPSTAATDRGKKMQLFARYGVPEYWIVDPAAETIEVYELGAGGYDLRATATSQDVVTSSALPAHTFTARSIFPQR